MREEVGAPPSTTANDVTLLPTAISHIKYLEAIKKRNVNEALMVGFTG